MGSDTLILMLTLIMIISTNVPPRVPYTMTSEAVRRSPHSLSDKLCLSSMMQEHMAHHHDHPRSHPWLIPSPSHWCRIVLMCPLPHLYISPRCCQIWQICHWGCSTSYICTSSCHPGSEATSCCNSNTSYASSYTTHSMQTTTCSMLTTTNADTIHWSLTKCNWHSPCCPTLISPKQEAPVQASWRDVDLDCPLQMIQMMPWPRTSSAQPLKHCIPESHLWWCDRMS